MEDHQHEDNNHLQLTIDHPYLEDSWQNPPRHLPIDIIGGLRFDMVYSPSLEPVARWPPEAPGLWEWWEVDGFVEETWIDGGLTRFKLDGQGGKAYLGVRLDRETFWKGWLSQSARVFNPLKTTGHQESFFMVNPPWILTLQPTQQEYETYDGFPAFFDLCDATEETRSIYLFLYPPPMTVSELISWLGGRTCTHFWSFDKDGRIRISEEERRQWGIPMLTPDTDYCTDLFTWPTHIHTALRNWQIARGFNPGTADWARECGYPELEIVGAKKDDQFEEISEQPEKSRWSWSRLWAAIPGSDISAFAC